MTSRVVRPGIEASFGNHEERIRALERAFAPFSVDARDSLWIQTQPATFVKNVDKDVDWNAQTVQVVFGGYPAHDAYLDGTYTSGVVLTGQSYVFDNTASPTYDPITILRSGFYLVTSALHMSPGGIALDNPFYMGIKDLGLANTETFVERESLKSQRFDTNNAFGSPAPGDPKMWKTELMGFAENGTYGVTVRHNNSVNPANNPAVLVTIFIVRLLGSDG